jgi:hypothetical protein
MESKNIKVLLIAIVITLAGSGLALGQDSVALSVEPSALRALETGGIAGGQKLKIEGIVINQNDQSFTMRDAKGSETLVIVTKKTIIKKKRKGWFYGPRTSSADDIRCGLSLKVEGRGNSDGQLIAKNITIEELDQGSVSVRSTTGPVERLPGACLNLTTSTKGQTLTNGVGVKFGSRISFSKKQ